MHTFTRKFGGVGFTIENAMWLLVCNSDCFVVYKLSRSVHVCLPRLPRSAVAGCYVEEAKGSWERANRLASKAQKMAMIVKVRGCCVDVTPLLCRPSRLSNTIHCPRVRLAFLLIF